MASGNLNNSDTSEHPQTQLELKSSDEQEIPYHSYNYNLMSELSWKLIEKRNQNSFRNLPGYLSTASSVDSFDINKADVNSCDHLDNLDLKHEDLKKRKRVNHDYRKLSKSGYVDDAIMGRRYSSSTPESTSETDSPAKIIKITSNHQNNEASSSDRYPNSSVNGTAKDTLNTNGRNTKTIPNSFLFCCFSKYFYKKENYHF